MVCITIEAAVFAGSSRFPIPLGRLKLNRLQNSMLSSTVYVLIAIATPDKILSKFIQNFDSIFYLTQSYITGMA